MNFWFLTAGVGMALVWAIHTFIGGREVAQRLREVPGLKEMPRWVLWYCWHLVTMTLAALSLALIWAAMDGRAVDVGLFAGFLVLAFGVFGLILPKRVGQTLMTMPQGLLIAPWGVIALIGASV